MPTHVLIDIVKEDGEPMLIDACQAVEYLLRMAYQGQKDAEKIDKNMSFSQWLEKAPLV